MSTRLIISLATGLALFLGSQGAAAQTRIQVQRGPVRGPSVLLPFTHPLSASPALWTDGTLGPVEIDRSVGTEAPGDGPPLIIGGQLFARGFGTRATSAIAYDLEGEAAFFESWIGIDDAVGNSGSAIFQVVADGLVIYDSGIVRGNDPAQFTGRLSVMGVRELLLIARDADDGFTSDHADWAEPTVYARSAPNGAGAALRARRGTWGPELPWPVLAMQATLLSSGHIISYASRQPSAPGTSPTTDPHDTTAVDRATIGTWFHTTVDHPTEEIYGASTARLRDGTPLMVGGFGGRSGREPFGQDQSSRFDPVVNGWLPAPPMVQPRWGSGALTLGDGSVLAIGGAHAGGNTFRPERYDGARWSALDGVNVQPWLQTGDLSLDRTYPAVHLTRLGKVFWSGWDETMAVIDLTGPGSVEFTGPRESVQRAWGTSSQQGPSLITLVGGVDHRGSPGAAERSAIRINLGGPTPQTIQSAPMTFRRADHNATILADGTLFVNGGAAEHGEGVNPAAVSVPEIYDARTDTWTLAAAAPTDRAYRSTALLLPSGEVWTGGGDGNQTARVFTPPYLYDPSGNGQLAARPGIQAAPGQVAYGQTFAVTVASVAPITRLSFVRTGSATHGVNGDQRYLELAYSQSGNVLTITAPPTGDDAPPGDYMLFAFGANGVPSVARFVHIGPPRPTVWDFVFSSDGTSPEPRHETAMAEVGGKLYLVGGRGLKQTQEYDPVRRTWRNLGPPPFEIHHFQPIVADGKIFVVGAFTGGYPNESNVGNIWIFDPQTGAWTSSTALPPGRARGGAGAVAYGAKFYLVCGNNQGHNGGARPWFDVFDPATQTWTQLPDAPRARDHFLASVVGNRLVVAGGRTTDLPNPFDRTIPEVDVYDFTSGTWSTLTENIPTERAGTMAVPIGRHVVVVGGESNSQVAAHREVEALDVLHESWTSLPDLIQGRHSGGIATIDGRIFVVSGSGNRGGSPELGTVEFLAASDVLESLAGLPGSNAIINPGFDEGFAGWLPSSGVKLSEEGGVAPPAARVAGTLTTAAPVTGGNNYELRLLYRSTAGSGTATVQATYLNAQGATMTQFSEPLGPAADLTSGVIVAPAPVGAQTVRIQIATTGTRTVTVDDVSLVRL